jgi:hypothetical protein
VARLIAVLLVTLAAAIVVAIVRDRRRRGREAAAGLRTAFLHRALAEGPLPAASPREVVGNGGRLSLRVPDVWLGDPRGRGALSHRYGDDRSLTIEVETLPTSGADRDAVAAALRGLRPEGERTVEVVSSGAVLMKSLDTMAAGGQERVVYCWRLATPAGPGRALVAVVRLSVSADRADELVVRSDVAAAERAVREAALSPAGATAGGA